MSTQEWQKKKAKKSPMKKPEKDVPNQLSEIFKQNYCVYFLMGKCNNGSRCINIHMNKDVLFEKLQKIIMDPTQIPNLSNDRSDISNYIMENTNIKKYGKPPFLTSCWYSLRNMDCNNMKDGRYIIYNFDFDGEEVPLYICYPKAHTCKTRVTCGLHFDIKFKYVDNTFTMESLLSPEASEDRVEEVSIEKKESDPKDEELSELRNMISTLQEQLEHVQRKCDHFKAEYLAVKKKRDQILYVPEQSPPKKQYTLDPYLDMSSQDEIDSYESEDELERNRKYWGGEPDYENDEDFMNDVLYGGKQYEEVF